MTTDSYFDFPWFTNVAAILGVFLVALVAFHMFLLRVFPQTSIRWKQADYVWLPMTLLGLIGAVVGNRTEVASTLSQRAKIWASASYQEVVSRASSGSGPAVCRSFSYSRGSIGDEPTTDYGKQLAQQCAWFVRVRNQLPASPPPDWQDLPVDELVSGQPSAGDPWYYTSFRESLKTYNEAARKTRNLKPEMNRSDLIDFIKFLGPCLVAIALALRITKVSGEISLERKKLRPDKNGA